MDEARDRASDARARMVDAQLKTRDISNPRVLTAMAAVPRDAFVDDMLREQAYQDRPLPIGSGQTISQPYIVARMTELLAVALQFVLAHPVVASVIPGARSAAEIADAVSAVATVVPDELWNDLKADGLLRQDAPC